jgi:hypothetical protein
MPKQKDYLEIIELTEQNIESMVYFIRGQKVMLDFDLARIYGYETKVFNQQVKRNISKFPEDFMFQLTAEDVNAISRNKKSTLDNDIDMLKTEKTLNESEKLMRSQNVTPQIWNTSNTGGRTYLPYAFTEQGIYMLMTVLKGELAIKQSIALIRLFKQMKDYISENRSILNVDSALINNKFSSYDKRFETIENKLNIVMDNFIDPSTYKHFFILEGEKIEAALAYQQIYSLAEHSIIIIDDYIGLRTIQLLKVAKPDIDIIIFSDNVARDSIDEQTLIDFNNEYHRDIKLFKNDKKFHDRYIVIDYTYPNEAIYHSGPSSKNAGHKISTITKIDEMKAYRPLLNDLLRNIR